MEQWTCFRDDRGCSYATGREPITSLEDDALGELARLMESCGKCHEDVTRKGLSQPCEKTAVAVRIDPEHSAPYPVCAFHARGEMVPLARLWKLWSA